MSLDGPGLVQILAGLSLVALIVLVPATQGFVRLTPVPRLLLAIAGMLMLIASAGVVAAFPAPPVVLIRRVIGSRILR